MSDAAESAAPASGADGAPPAAGPPPPPPPGGGPPPPRVKKLKHSTATTDPPTSPRGEAMSEPPAFVGGAVQEIPAVPFTRIQKNGWEKSIRFFFLGSG